MFTVYCCDTFDGTQWQQQFAVREDAIAFADKMGGTMLVCHVDDPSGKLIYRTGQF